MVEVDDKIFKYIFFKQNNNVVVQRNGVNIDLYELCIIPQKKFYLFKITIDCVENSFIVSIDKTVLIVQIFEECKATIKNRDNNLKKYRILSKFENGTNLLIVDKKDFELIKIGDILINEDLEYGEVINYENKEKILLFLQKKKRCSYDLFSKNLGFLDFIELCENESNKSIFFNLSISTSKKIVFFFLFFSSIFISLYYFLSYGGRLIISIDSFSCLIILLTYLYLSNEEFKKNNEIRMLSNLALVDITLFQRLKNIIIINALCLLLGIILLKIAESAVVLFGVVLLIIFFIIQIMIVFLLRQQDNKLHKNVVNKQKRGV